MNLTIDVDPSGKDKVLHVLGEVYRQHHASFHKALPIKGIAAAQADAGRDPAPIPGSEYWLETNLSTPQKAKVLLRLLDRLGYSDRDIVDALCLVLYKRPEWQKRRNRARLADTQKTVSPL